MLCALAHMVFLRPSSFCKCTVVLSSNLRGSARIPLKGYVQLLLQIQIIFVSLNPDMKLCFSSLPRHFIFKADYMYKVNSHHFLAHQSIGFHPSHSRRSQAALTEAVQIGGRGSTHPFINVSINITSVVTVRCSQLQRGNTLAFGVEWPNDLIPKACVPSVVLQYQLVLS